MTYQPISVTELNTYIKEKFNEDEYLNNVLIKGEISNFKNHYTGHMYFTLKDENSLIKCVMFKTYTPHLDFMPKDGMKVMVLGSVSVYERDGVYQIYAKAMKQEGIGDLHAEYEKLKQKLEQEGLFEKSHKKDIPYMPKCIGVLTSNTGAVIRDIINVSTRRNPNIYIKLFPVPVQGQGASEKIAKAIEIMNKEKLADVLIIARGGGSLEDLWTFNEEIVARAIYNSELPIISAVGHETDFTISDFVSDLRAPTPSAAAEIAVPEISEIQNKLENNKRRIQNALRKKIEIMRLRYEKCMTNKSFTDPLEKVNKSYMLLDKEVKRLETSINIKIKEKKTYMVQWITKLDTLSPLKTLTRGFSIVTNQDGKVITSVNKIKKSDKVTLRFVDGEKKAEII
ncbi:MAG: exodeoxyribonuclease VII large subunit [Clostridiaceae bacterium]|nr:exodeoxyribonuclease VII large subunit [Clostridiaceae bacterium]